MSNKRYTEKTRIGLEKKISSQRWTVTRKMLFGLVPIKEQKAVNTRGVTKGIQITRASTQLRFSDRC